MPRISVPSIMVANGHVTKLITPLSRVLLPTMTHSTVGADILDVRAIVVPLTS